MRLILLGVLVLCVLLLVNNSTSRSVKTRVKRSLTCSGTHVSAVKPTSVHQLRVGDIQIVAALGDSLTAGNGARSTFISDATTEYRGAAFSIGGDDSFDSGATTLTNIIREFNPSVYGFSTGSGTVDQANSKFNMAVPGSIAQNMPGQANALLDRMRNDANIDFDNDWKVVTLFIGGNNLCDFCEDVNFHSASNFRASIESALDILHNALPKALVNVVEIFDIGPVATIASSNFLCSLVIRNVCPCPFGGRKNLRQISSLAAAYQQELNALVGSGKYDTRPDFTVVVQPYLRDTTPPKSGTQYDTSYFAPDCFHFSVKGHNAAGKGLWNNMLQPVGSKMTEWGLNDPVSCPQGDFIPTRLN